MEQVQEKYNQNIVQKEYSRNRKEELKQKKIALKQEKRRHYKNIALILCMFFVLLAVSYRSSLITEKFNEIQNKKEQLASIEKVNGQLEVGIEESVNLGTIEKEAKENLGMKKISNNQKVYVNLNNEDYTESTKSEITAEKESNWFQKIMNKILGN